MRRSICLILTAVFLSALCIPCAAMDMRVMKQRGYSDFSDVAAESSYFGAVKTCYESGWMDGISEDRFGVHEPLSKADMVRLLARLYNLSRGGDGTIPELPGDLGDYVQFYDEDGKAVHKMDWSLDFVGGRQELTVIFRDENLPYETLRAEIGFSGDELAFTASGVRTDYDGEDTYYIFSLPEGVNGEKLDLWLYQKDTGSWLSTWQAESENTAPDPTPYDAVLYLMYRTRERLPYCFRTGSLDAFPYIEVWRMEFAVPLAAICTDLPEIREAASVPDLPDWRFGQEETEAVLSLYRKGILNGFDEAGTFYGSDWLTRGEAALIISRVLNRMQYQNT